MKNRFWVRSLAGMVLSLAAGTAALAADVVNVTVANTGSAQSNVPVTFGQVFKPGDVPAGAVVGARIGSTALAVQVDKKAAHADGSLRHAVISTLVPSLASGGSQVITLTNSGSAPSGTAPSVSAVLGTAFDTTINLNIGGTPYTASARALLSGTPSTWLQGPKATEWLLSAPLRNASGAAHPHLQARFHVRAYEGLQAVRVEAVVENIWAHETGPRNYTYNATVSVAGRGAVFSQSNVNHYRQSRWRRVVWWGTQPSFTVKHDRAYLMATRAVPTYDTRVQVSGGALDGWINGLGANPGLMSIGDLDPNMPSPGGRFEIAPLPAFQAGYILSQDDRARRATIGYGEQAGAWPMHYRDKTTGHPISIDTYPNASILGGSGIYGTFPACGGTCSTPLLPEASHHPSLAYLPYLITGDYYLMEELVFWGNWTLFYGESGRHGGSQGLLVWDQVRGQAWMLRTLAQAAYATPDSHPMKQYLVSKLQNNISYYRTNWVNSNPLGYVTNTGAANWLGLDDWIATWMDDFLTWTFGHIVGLGFTEAQPVLAWKAKFPVGRLTDSGMCWVLASSYWPYVRGDRYAGGTSSFVTDWTSFRRNLIFGWDDDAFRGTNAISGQEQTLFNAACGSSQMYSILGIGSGSMIGWDGPDAYAANLQAATAVAVEAGVPNAQAAFNRLTSRSAYPLSGYGSQPQWALFPAGTGSTAPSPTATLNANPATIAPGGNSTLSWSSSNATSCVASGAWSGNKATSGSQAVGPLSATADYTLTCNGTAGSASDSARVTVQQSSPTPTLTFSATPTSVAYGGSVSLSWSSTNATSCAASGAPGWSGSRPTVTSAWVLGNRTSNQTFTLQCTGAGGSITRTASITVQSPGGGAPTLTFSATPTSVAYGGSVSLAWTSTNATSCTASGAPGWSGSRPLATSSWVLGNRTSNQTFTLQCSGPGGSVTRNASITVSGSGTPAPTINLTANPTTVAPGGSSALTWSTSNATSCTASGGWSGSKATSGNQTVSSIQATTIYTLACSGAGGSTSRNATVTVNGSSASLFGSVDSNYVDRFATNRVYVFSGTVTPDDIDGNAVDPVVTIPVNQDANACTFGYAGSGLAAGTYTIAFTNDAAADAPGVSNNLVFVGTRQVTISGSGVTSNFRPSGILQVGSGKPYATLRAAQLAAQDGAVIEIDAGNYRDDVIVWRQNNVTIRGVGGRAHIRGNRRIPFESGNDRNNGMGLIVVRGSDISVENIEFSNAMVDDMNGAGIRNQGHNLSICNWLLPRQRERLPRWRVRHAADRVLGIRTQRFGDRGRTHNLYVDDGERRPSLFRYNYTRHASIGHPLKTRAARTTSSTTASWTRRRHLELHHRRAERRTHLRDRQPAAAGPNTENATIVATVPKACRPAAHTSCTSSTTRW